MSEGAECTIIGEEAGPDGKVWFACDDDDSSTVGGTECVEESFGTGGGLGIVPDPDPNPAPEPNLNPNPTLPYPYPSPCPYPEPEPQP